MKNILFLLTEKNSALYDDLLFEKYKKYPYFVTNKKTQRNIITEIIDLINREQVDTLVCASEQINIASRILWQSKNIKRYILGDTDNPMLVENRNQRIETRMWDFIATKAEKGQIQQTGWVSSFTGDYFTQQEIEEFIENTVMKLSAYITKSSKVLEIGIASGLTCCAIAPKVETYIGIDLSSETLKRTKETLADRRITNVYLKCADAMDIDKLQVKGQNLIILNSVLQYFPGYNYLIALLNKLLKCIDQKAIVYLGDLIDTGLIEKFIEELSQHGKKKNSKDDLSYPKDFIRELPAYIPEIVEVQITEKIGKIENELKKYRYDALLFVDKNNKRSAKHTKFQYAMKSDDFSLTRIVEREVSENT